MIVEVRDEIKIPSHSIVDCREQNYVHLVVHRPVRPVNIQGRAYTRREKQHIEDLL